MNITPASVDGMTPQEKDTYFAHMAMRHEQERVKIEDEKTELAEYRARLITYILRNTDRFTEEDLKIKSTRTLERIWEASL